MQKLSSRSLLIGTPLLIFVLSPLWLSPVRTLLAPPEMALVQTDRDSDKQRFRIEGLTYFQSEGNRQNIRLTASQAFSEDMDKEITLTDIAAELTNDKGKTLNIESREALYHPPNQRITLQRSVTLHMEDFTGRTELLYFYPEAQLAQTTEAVSLARPGVKIEGTGLNYDIGTEELVVGGYGRVSCSIEQKGNKS